MLLFLWRHQQFNFLLFLLFLNVYFVIKMTYAHTNLIRIVYMMFCIKWCAPDRTFRHVETTSIQHGDLFICHAIYAKLVFITFNWHFVEFEILWTNLWQNLFWFFYTILTSSLILFLKNLIICFFFLEKKIVFYLEKIVLCKFENSIPQRSVFVLYQPPFFFVKLHFRSNSKKKNLSHDLR